MAMRTVLIPFLVVGLLIAACGGDDAAGATPDLEVDRRVGYAVVVEDRPNGLSIGFSDDRDAQSGEEFDLSESIWTTDGGPWLEPPVMCVALGQRIELGVVQVENEARPGLLKDRVVWVACLPPEGA
jgi:hypothetical protein